MNREIKFRAWNSSKKEMYLNCGVHPHLLSDLSAEDDYYEKHDEGRYIVHEDDCYKVMQYTGLKDKHGVEIYEGDIVKALTVDVIRPQDAWKCKDKYITSSIYWDSNMCAFETDFNCFMPFESEKLVEVIGNIHQNPNLLNPTLNEPTTTK